MNDGGGDLTTVRHSVTGRWRLGLFLAVVAMLAWGTVPVALTLALAYLDPWTLTWFRFFVAAIYWQSNVMDGSSTGIPPGVQSVQFFPCSMPSSQSQ